VTKRKHAKGRTDLHDAAVDADVARVRELLAQGADSRAADASGWTPLHFAAQSRDVVIVKMLLDAGADVDVQDVHGNTPLFRAVFASQGRGDCIELLRRHGADPTKRNHHGVSPVDLARGIANYDVSRWFADMPPSAKSTG
jgi:ankyrin repeat protein